MPIFRRLFFCYLFINMAVFLSCNCQPVCLYICFPSISCLSNRHGFLPASSLPAFLSVANLHIRRLYIRCHCLFITRLSVHCHSICVSFRHLPVCLSPVCLSISCLSPVCLSRVCVTVHRSCFGYASCLSVSPPVYLSVIPSILEFSVCFLPTCHYDAGLSICQSPFCLSVNACLLYCPLAIYRHLYVCISPVCLSVT